MSYKIFRISDISFNNINFTRPQIVQNNIIIPLYYNINNTRSPLLIQVPSLLLDNPYSGKNSIILPLKGRNEISTKSVCDFFNQLDRTIIIKLKDILNKLKKNNRYKINYQNVSYKSIVNEIDTDNEIYKNGLIKYKLFNGSKFKTVIYDDNKEIIPVYEYSDRLTKGVYIKSIIEINSIIINNDVIKVYVKPHQLRVFEQGIERVDLTTYSFIDSDDEIINSNIDYNQELMSSIHTEKILEEDNDNSNNNNMTFIKDNIERKLKNRFGSETETETEIGNNTAEQMNEEMNKFMNTNYDTERDVHINDIVENIEDNDNNNNSDIHTVNNDDDDDNNNTSSEMDGVEEIDEITSGEEEGIYSNHINANIINIEPIEYSSE